MVGMNDYGFLYTTGSVRLMSTMRVKSRHSGMGDGDEDVKRPSIDDFDSEISIFKGIHDQIDGLDDFVSVGWIGVNMKPAKHLVCALITKWIYVYSNFLSKQTIVALDSLGKFLEETEPDVEHLSYSHHTMESLMKLMKVFNKVGSQQKVMDYKSGAIHRSQAILEKYGYPLSYDRVQCFHLVPQLWNTLKKKVSLAKQRVSPHVQSHTEIVMEELERFGKQCVDLHEEFLVSPCLDYDCTDEEAGPLITKYSTTVKGLKTTAQDLIELQDLLEETVFNFSHLSEFVDELLVLQIVRDLRANIEESHNEWLKVRWKEIINIASLKVLSELNLEQIQSLPEFTLDWDIRQRLEQSVTEIVSCLPLIKVLSSAAMRPRHWKQVLRLCAKSVSQLSLNPASFVDMDFKQFIDLGLQGHVPEVEAIAVKVESAIKNFEEVWLSKLFDLTDYQRSYPTTRTETHHSSVAVSRRSSRTHSVVAATANIPAVGHIY